MKIDGKNEISVLHRALLAAKFSNLPENDELAGDPALAGVSNDIYEEMQNPTKLDGDLSKWKLHTIYPAHIDCRNRPLVELLFCMLRSKHNSSNQQ